MWPKTVLEYPQQLSLCLFMFGKQWDPQEKRRTDKYDTCREGNKAQPKVDGEIVHPSQETDRHKHINT